MKGGAKPRLSEIGGEEDEEPQLQELKELVEEMQEELDYGKQRENKLMFFLFVLKEKGFPISEVFEQEIKDIPTTRFSVQFDDEYKQMYFEIQKERKEKKKSKKENDQTYLHCNDFSPLSDRVFSYAMTGEVPAQQKSMRRSMSQTNYSVNESCMPVTQEQRPPKGRPSCVPRLDLLKVLTTDKSSSSSSSEDEDGNKIRKGPNPKQQKKILDKYNIHTCARNLQIQQKDRLLRKIKKIERMSSNHTSKY